MVGSGRNVTADMPVKCMHQTARVQITAPPISVRQPRPRAATIEPLAMTAMPIATETVTVGQFHRATAGARTAAMPV